MLTIKNHVQSHSTFHGCCLNEVTYSFIMVTFHIKAPRISSSLVMCCTSLFLIAYFNVHIASEFYNVFLCMCLEVNIDLEHGIHMVETAIFGV